MPSQYRQRLCWYWFMLLAWVIPMRPILVHLDLSPRATKSMGSVDRTQFLQMIESDLKWFLRSLGLCHYLKAAIIAGSVTGRYYFDEFLLAKLPKPFAITQRIRFELKPRGADQPPFPPPTETRNSR